MSDFPFKHNSQYHICFASEKKNQLTNMQVGFIKWGTVSEYRAKIHCKWLH